MTEPRPDDTLSYYSPPPEPRPTWSQEAWNAAATPSQWIEPYPARPPSKPEPARGTGAGLVVVAALLAAVLASGGTYAALDLTGNLNRPAPEPAANAGAAGSGSPSQQVVTVNEQSAIVQAARDVSPAVVTITTQQQASALDPFALPATGVGSGIIYNPSGWIVTNHHVVAGATNNQVQVQLKDGRTLTGSVYGLDTLTDLAIVKISGSNLPAAPIGDSGSLQPGQLAIAIGSPLGTFTNSVTSGIISALGRQIQVTDDQTGQPVTLHNLIQTDAAINPGNSGGALVNAAGQVIGINTATASTAQGIGFAIPINIARPIMAQAVAGQPLTRPWIGIHFTSLDPQAQQQLKTPLDYGAFIGPADATAGQPLVEPGSPAAQAGLKAGDIITALDGQRVDVAHPLDMLLVTHSPGQTVTLQVLRNGQQLTLKVTLGTRPASAAEQ